MKVFLTGASGTIGSAVAARLLAAGHTVDGLARSENAAERMKARGIEPRLGDLRDPLTLAQYAAEADAVIHAGFTWDAGARDVETAATAALVRSAKRLLATSGMAVLGDTGAAPAGEDRAPDAAAPLAWRVPLEARVLDQGGIVIRPALVYDENGHRLVRKLIEASRAAGAGVHAGDGTARWSTVYAADIAALYVDALERAPAGTLLHASSGIIGMRELAAAISQALGFEGRTQSAELDAALTRTLVISSERARALLGWNPTGPTLAAVIASSAECRRTAPA